MFPFVNHVQVFLREILSVYYYYYHYYYLLLGSFPLPFKLVVFHWNLSDSKYPQVSSTLFSILAVLNNAVVWRASTRPLISKSSSPFINPLVTVPKAQILILLFTFFQFYSVVRCNDKVHNFSSSLFLELIIIRSGLLAEIKWSVCFWKSHRGLCVSFSRTDAGLCIYNLFVWSHFNFLHNSQWITVLTQSCQVLYYYYYYYYYYLLIRVFHISVSWWSFTGDWVTANLLKSPGLFSVFWPFLIMLLFGGCPLGRQLSNPPGPLTIL